MADEKLNSLNRFRKHPGRLVLEEHDNCEVPAGCGGVVLRWLDPRATVPIILYLYTPAQATCFLDGAEVKTGRPDLAPGPHVLAVLLKDVDLSVGFLMFAATHPPAHRASAPEEIEPTVDVLSTDDGSWKFHFAPLPTGWTESDFEDHSWPSLVAVAAPQLEQHAPGSYQRDHCAELGAICLGVPAGGKLRRGVLGIRKAFIIPSPVDPQP